MWGLDTGIEMGIDTEFETEPDSRLPVRFQRLVEEGLAADASLRQLNC
jgi:hypothetical protein